MPAAERHFLNIARKGAKNAKTHRVRGKHHEAYKAGTNVIFLEPDLASVFPDSASVNRVLRLLLNLAKENVSTQRTA